MIRDIKCRHCHKNVKRNRLVIISFPRKNGKKFEQQHCPLCGEKLIWREVEDIRV